MLPNLTSHLETNIIFDCGVGGGVSKISTVETEELKMSFWGLSTCLGNIRIERVTKFYFKTSSQGK